MLQRSWLWLFALYSAAALPLFAWALANWPPSFGAERGPSSSSSAPRTSGGQASRESHSHGVSGARWKASASPGCEDGDHRDLDGDPDQEKPVGEEPDRGNRPPVRPPREARTDLGHDDARHRHGRRLQVQLPESASASHGRQPART